MEKPDANGFVTITWPSKTIPHGGIFHTPVVEPSKANREFLKVLLEEQKLSIAQRKKSAWGLRQEDEPKPEPARSQVPLVRPRTSKRRSLSSIRESGIYEVEKYVPLKRGEDREQLKDRLAAFMAYGNAPQQTTVPPADPAPTKPKPKLPTSKEMRNDIVTQIRERAEWLAEMEALGEAGPHHDVIQDQIAERLRMLDAMGVYSQCSSARSSATSFSTLRSREPKSPTKEKSVKSNRSASVKSNNSAHSSHSRVSHLKQTSTRSSAKSCVKEESVEAYKHLPKLQYSPRRRV